MVRQRSFECILACLLLGLIGVDSTGSNSDLIHTRNHRVIEQRSRSSNSDEKLLRTTCRKSSDQAIKQLLVQLKAGSLAVDDAEGGESALARLAIRVANPKNIPLFEFGSELGRILAVSKDIDAGLLGEAELVFQEYMSKLRDYYLAVFQRNTAASAASVESGGNSKHEQFILSCKKSTLNDCGKSMNAAVPRGVDVGVWKYDGFVSELESDMMSFIDDISARQSVVNSVRPAAPVPTTRIGQLRAKLLKQGRWFAVQCGLLLFNFIQNEWVRLTASTNSFLTRTVLLTALSCSKSLVFLVQMCSNGGNQGDLQRNVWLKYLTCRCSDDR